MPVNRGCPNSYMAPLDLPDISTRNIRSLAHTLQVDPRRPSHRTIHGLVFLGARILNPLAHLIQRLLGGVVIRLFGTLLLLAQYDLYLHPLAEESLELLHLGLQIVVTDAPANLELLCLGARQLGYTTTLADLTLSLKLLPLVDDFAYGVLRGDIVLWPSRDVGRDHAERLGVAEASHDVTREERSVKFAIVENHNLWVLDLMILRQTITAGLFKIELCRVATVETSLVRIVVGGGIIIGKARRARLQLSGRSCKETALSKRELDARGAAVDEGNELPCDSFVTLEWGDKDSIESPARALKARETAHIDEQSWDLKEWRSERTQKVKNSSHCGLCWRRLC